MKTLLKKARETFFDVAFGNSASYWERRYAKGGTSGDGSYGELARFKAEFLNAFIQDNGVESVIEFGCGDGNQLSLAQYPRYLGLDVSKVAIDMCRDRFADDRTKSFLWYDPPRTKNIANFLQADLTLSLDVIYHLVEDSAYDLYLETLFAVSRKNVLVYSSNEETASPVPHVRHRNFTRDVERRFESFRLVDTVKNRYPDQSACSFYVFARSDGRG